MTFHLFTRNAAEDCPAGITVSKRRTLPDGDFGITEYIWGPVSLWFIDADEFTSDERQTIYDLLTPRVPR